MWLAVFGVATIGLPVADALAGHASDVVAHWEDADDRDCPPQHDVSACQVCQANGAARRCDAQGVGPVPATGLRTQAPESALLGDTRSVRRGSPTTRGPPLG